ncbi:MAG: hypothetical protein AAB421_03725 [Patescibacteria group bacterium]
MKDVKSLLSRFLLFVPIEITVKKTAIQVITKELSLKNIPIDVEYKNNIVFLKAPPTIKHAIFIQKEKLLKKINEEMRGVSVIDIC